MSTEPQKVTVKINGLHFWAFLVLVVYTANYIVDKTPLSPQDRAPFEHVAVIWAERARLPAPRTATCFDWRCTVSAGEPPTLYSVSCTSDASYRARLQKAPSLWAKGWSDDSTCLLLGAGR